MSAFKHFVFSVKDEVVYQIPSLAIYKLFMSSYRSLSGQKNTDTETDKRTARKSKLSIPATLSIADTQVSLNCHIFSVIKLRLQKSIYFDTP